MINQPPNYNSIVSAIILSVLLLILVHINVTHASLYVKFEEKGESSPSSLVGGFHLLSCRNLGKDLSRFEKIDVSDEIGERLVTTLKDSMAYAQVLKPPDRISPSFLSRYISNKIGIRIEQRKSEEESNTLNGHGLTENRKICKLLKEVIIYEKDQRRRGNRSGTSGNILSISFKKTEINKYESALLRGARSIHNVVEVNLEKVGSQINGLADVARNVLTVDQFPESDVILQPGTKTE